MMTQYFHRFYYYRHFFLLQTEQLTTHLNKYAWSETISVLLEHEIDGESLFLVSKGQLVTIGVSEEHADVICQFVKS